jgi:hypothetical protein
MTPKRKKLEALRSLILSGKISERDHARLFIEDADGSKVRLMSDEALPAIERRLAALDEQEAEDGIAQN